MKRANYEKFYCISYIASIMFSLIVQVLLSSSVLSTNSIPQNSADELSVVTACMYWDGRDKDSLVHYSKKLPAVLVKHFLQPYKYYLDGRIADSDSLKDLYFSLAAEKALFYEDFHLVGQSLYRKGRLLRKVGLYDSALASYKRVHQLFDRRAEGSLIEVNRRRCVLFTSQAFLSNRLNKYESSIEYSLSSLRIAEEHRFDDLKLISLINLSASYGELLPFKLESRGKLKLLSRDYMLQAAGLAEKLGDKRRLNRSYGNIGIYYYDEGLIDSAKYFLNRAVLIADEIADHFGLTNHHNMLITIAKEENQLYEAEFHGRRAMKSAVAIGSERMEADIMLTLAELQIAKLDFESAKDYLYKSLSISNRLGTPRISASCYERLYEISIKNEEKDLALGFYQKHIAYRDSIVNIDNLNRIEELRTQYETEKKEQQIASLEREAVITEFQIKQQRLFLYASVMILLIGGIASYNFARNRNLSSIQQRMVVEQKLLRSQMNPHFLFNALSSVHGYIYEGNKKQAAEYLSLFSDLTRDVLDYSSFELITLKKELNTLDKYVALQKTRFPWIDYKTSIHGGIDSEEILVPPMLLQPFIENSIDHGFKSRGFGSIAVGINVEDSFLKILIEDNGSGLAENNKESHHSKAIEITKERVSLLSGVKKKKDKLIVRDRFDEQGVVVEIYIPMIERV